MSNTVDIKELELYVSRMRTSQDASDRVKAAGELGDIGTPEIAPAVMEAVWEDPKSNVREMAIQSYAEIMGDDGSEQLGKVALEHFDPNVQFYAIYKLGTLSKEKSLPFLERVLNSKDEKHRAMAIKQIIKLNASETSAQLLDILRDETYVLAQRNILEALAIFKYKEAKNQIRDFLTSTNNQELLTFGNFALACFGDKSAKKYLETEELERLIRVSYKDKIYRGRNGLLEIVNMI